MSGPRCYARMRSLHCYGSVATALVLFCVTTAACQKSEPTASTEIAASTPKQGASAVDPKNPCTLPSASAAHVAQALGTSKLKEPKLYPSPSVQKCQYYAAEPGGDSVAIELDLNASSINLDSARRLVEQYGKSPTTDVPGFGDKAFSHTSTTDLGKTKLVINTLSVLKGKVLVVISSPASFEKIRALQTDLLRDLGAL